MWFAVEPLTFFTVGSLETVSTQTKHVFTRGQGENGGAPIETDLTCRTKGRLHKQWTDVDVFEPSWTSVTWMLRGQGPRRRRHRGRGWGGRENEKILLSSASQNVLKEVFKKKRSNHLNFNATFGYQQEKNCLTPSAIDRTARLQNTAANVFSAIFLPVCANWVPNSMKVLARSCLAWTPSRFKLSRLRRAGEEGALQLAERRGVWCGEIAECRRVGMIAADIAGKKTETLVMLKVVSRRVASTWLEGWWMMMIKLLFKVCSWL